MATSNTLRSTRFLSALLFAGIVGVATFAIRTQGNPARSEWTYYGGDKGATRYSPLDQITRDNVKNLRVAWRRPAVDPQLKQTYYAISHTQPWVYDLVKPTDPKATMDYAIDVGRGPSTRHTDIKGPQGLPLTTPPYGRITAYDMNKGDKVWTVANGDGPRNHPLLKDLNLPPLGIPGRPAPLLTKTLLFIGEGSDAVFSSAGGDKFRAYDKATGQVVWETDLPAGTTGAPMTYMANGQQFIVVPVGSKAHDAEWVAFSLPSR